MLATCPAPSVGTWRACVRAWAGVCACVCNCNLCRLVHGQKSHVLLTFAGRDRQLAVHSGGGADSVLGLVALHRLCEQTAASHISNSLVAPLPLRADAAPKPVSALLSLLRHSCTSRQEAVIASRQTLLKQFSEVWSDHHLQALQAMGSGRYRRGS